MLRNKRLVAVLATLLVVVLAITGCGNKAADGGDSAEGTVKDTLIVAQGADAKSLDPHATNDQPSSRVMKQIYNTLVTTNVDLEIQPALATEWTNIDDRTVEFKLREDVKWHNGADFTAADVEFTFNRMLESPKVAHIIGVLESVEVVDDYTVRLVTEEPFGAILAHLAHTASSIINEAAVTEAGETYGQNPVGTGPYKFVEWAAGDKITLEANAEYFDAVSPIKTVVFRNIVEGTNRAIGLETGEVDVAYDIEPIDKQQVIGNDNLELVEEPSLSMAYIGFNTLKKPFDDVRVRQAIHHAVDSQSIIDTILEGAGTISTSPIGPKVFGHNAEVEGYEFDVEGAKALLADAGYADGFETTIWTNENPVRLQIAQIVQANLLEIGIKVSIEPLEWGSYLERTAAGEHDMFILGWTTVTADADYGLYALFHSELHGSAGNRSFYTNTEVDNLLDAAKVATDESERLELYAKAQELIVAEAPTVNLYYQTNNIGFQKNVKGVQLHPAGHHTVYGLSFE